MECGGEREEDKENSYALSAEQADTDRALRQLFGTAIANRYIDFCQLCSGRLPLKVSRPLAGHALRELDSLIRGVLAASMDALAQENEQRAKRRAEALRVLKDMKFDEETRQRAEKALKPQFNHRTQIEKIVKQLGLAPNGDIAKLWIELTKASRPGSRPPSKLPDVVAEPGPITRAPVSGLFLARPRTSCRYACRKRPPVAKCWTVNVRTDRLIENGGHRMIRGAVIAFALLLTGCGGGGGSVIQSSVFAQPEVIYHSSNNIGVTYFDAGVQASFNEHGAMEFGRSTINACFGLLETQSRFPK